MNRRPPKRSMPLKTYVRPELREQLQIFASRSSNVITLSEYLAEVLEQHAAVEIVKQTIGRRAGNQ